MPGGGGNRPGGGGIPGGGGLPGGGGNRPGGGGGLPGGGGNRPGQGGGGEQWRPGGGGNRPGWNNGGNWNHNGNWNNGNWNHNGNWNNNNWNHNTNVNWNNNNFNWNNGGWHNGNWNNGWGAWGGGYRPWGGGWGWGYGAGLATAGLVGLASPWSWGYYNYSNPYYSVPVGNTSYYYDYSQPLVATVPAYGDASYGAYAADPTLTTQQQLANAPPPDSGVDPAAGNPPAANPTDQQDQIGGIFESARALFAQGNYSARWKRSTRRVPWRPRIRTFTSSGHCACSP